ncbi:MAG: hypothetical protein M1825_000714 [Sarcosagium campestre]|nr:MAG: hypothetical protein M1825_000714 [Sarcosagium campestre]
MARTINVLLTSFPGLDLPSTLSLQTSSSSSLKNLKSQIYDRLPALNERLIITTTSNKELASSSSPVSSLLSDCEDGMLSLRLSVPLCGGKGGFGSQLRAAGGRMSSRKKKNQGEDNGSSRNLDGRRLRTVTEAKALAEYLAIKPEMDKKEKELRRKRWEEVIELAERKQEEVKNGANTRVDGQWAEDRAEAGERTREAVLATMESGDYSDNVLVPSYGSSGGGSAAASESSEEDEAMQESSLNATNKASVQQARTTRKLFGWDEDDDEFMSDVEEDEEDENSDSAQNMVKGKGRA